MFILIILCYLHTVTLKDFGGKLYLIRWKLFVIQKINLILEMYLFNEITNFFLTNKYMIS